MYPVSRAIGEGRAECFRTFMLYVEASTTQSSRRPQHNKILQATEGSTAEASALLFGVNTLPWPRRPKMVTYASCRGVVEAGDYFTAILDQTRGGVKLSTPRSSSNAKNFGELNACESAGGVVLW